MIAWHIAPTGSRTRPSEPLRASISTVGCGSSTLRESRPRGSSSTLTQTRQDRVQRTGTGSPSCPLPAWRSSCEGVAALVSGVLALKGRKIMAH